jgi:hypothetical protein
MLKVYPAQRFRRIGLKDFLANLFTRQPYMLYMPSRSLAMVQYPFGFFFAVKTPEKYVLKKGCFLQQHVRAIAVFVVFFVQGF